ncbi:MAG: cell division protein FtsX [Gammaproteobacteria bacterium]|nr:MAG: cell division protein FtsX [Gammaproteobacteria bacterium]
MMEDPIMSLSDRIGSWLSLHRHSLFSSLGKLLQTPFSSLLTILVIAIALMLPTTLHLLISNGTQVSNQLDSSNQISLFLKQSVSNETGEALAKKLGLDHDVLNISVTTKEAALKEFQQYSGFSSAIETLEINPLPVVIQLTPASELTTPEQIQPLLNRLESLPETDFAQLDMQWVQRLQAIVEIAERAIMLLALLLGLAVLLIIGNTIRLELQNRRDEIIITKLVGATDPFIRRPFLYSGFWYGLLSGLTAWLITAMIIFLLEKPVEKLSSLYESDFQLQFLAFHESLGLLGLSAFLGICGAWLVCSHHLKKMQPE